MKRSTMRTHRSPTSARCLLAGIVIVLAACGAPEYDLVLRNGTIVDGTGAPGFVGDVAVTGGHVMAVGDLTGARGAEEIDVSGAIVAPGFINLHSHARPAGLPKAVNLLSQGVTTVILNADGGGPSDVTGQLARVQAAGLAVNVGANIGLNTVWADVNGPDATRPSAEQIEEMKWRVDAGLDQGAWGVSAGLDYKPAYYATTDEVVRVLADAGRWRTVFTNHDRLTPETGYSSRVGMAETIEIGEATGLVPLITHMKIQGREQGTAGEVLAMMRAAAERGVYTAADAYPYLAGQTSLAALIIPGWAQGGGRERLLARFGDSELRARIVTEANEALEARFGGPSGVFLPEAQRELVEVMAELGVDTGGEAVVRILEKESPGAILRFGAEGDLVSILSHPTVSVACDCDASTGGPGHPRTWGTFPRVLGRYVREQGVLGLEEAVRKMSGLPAATIGMVDRGFIAAGMAADLVVFDAGTVLDHATYTDPNVASEGVRDVLVNGRWALRDGRATGEQAGLALLRSPRMPARPLDADRDRSVTLDGPVAWEGGQGPDGTVNVDLEQPAGSAAARGTFALSSPRQGLEATLEVAGTLHTAAGWAGFTGVARLGSGDLRPVTVLIDAADPFADEDGTTLEVHIAGMEPMVGRVAWVATVLSEE
jgi:N-acyl-D-amino-acid deacylase